LVERVDGGLVRVGLIVPRLIIVFSLLVELAEESDGSNGGGTGDTGGGRAGGNSDQGVVRNRGELDSDGDIIAQWARSVGDIRNVALADEAIVVDIDLEDDLALSLGELLRTIEGNGEEELVDVVNTAGDVNRGGGDDKAVLASGIAGSQIVKTSSVEDSGGGVRVIESDVESHDVEGLASEVRIGDLDDGSEGIGGGDLGRVGRNILALDGEDWGSIEDNDVEDDLSLSGRESRNCVVVSEGQVDGIVALALSEGRNWARGEEALDGEGEAVRGHDTSLNVGEGDSGGVGRVIDDRAVQDVSRSASGVKAELDGSLVSSAARE